MSYPADNLKKKGAEANPNGRPPKGYSITEMMKEMLKADPDLKKAIGRSVAKKALEGDMVAIKTLWQYMDGMPPQTIKGKFHFDGGVDYVKDTSETSQVAG